MSSPRIRTTYRVPGASRVSRLISQIQDAASSLALFAHLVGYTQYRYFQHHSHQLGSSHLPILTSMHGRCGVCIESAESTANAAYLDAYS